MANLTPDDRDGNRRTTQALLTLKVILEVSGVMTNGDTPVSVVALVTLTEHAIDTCSVAPAVAPTLHADVHVVNGPLRRNVLSREEALIPAEPGHAETLGNLNNPTF